MFRMMIVIFLGLNATACAEKAAANDGVLRNCRMMQEMNPEQTQGGEPECQCTANKIKALLTEEHYSILENYDTATVEIAGSVPGLQAPEIHARVLKAVSMKRKESPTYIIAEMNEFSSITQIAYGLCGVLPAQ